MTQDQFVQMLKDMAIKMGSQRKLALHLGIDPSFLGDVLKGNRAPGKHIPEQLGYEVRVMYIKKGQK